MLDLDLLIAGDVRRWADFDVELRRTYWPAGTRCTPREALVVAACSGDGYLREAAVHRLAVSSDPEALPLLLIRCVDWVAPVRAAARRAAVSKLDDSSLRAMLPLLGVLRRRQVDDWMIALLRENLPGLLDVALALEDRETRRWAHREALGLLSRERLLDIATRDEDFVVRAIAGTALLDRGECVDEALAAGAPKVRMRALTMAGGAEEYLADPTSAVRSMAQALVLKAGGDPAAHYRTLPDSFGVLAGLGETGTAGDAERLERALSHDHPRIRRAAVRGLRRIAPESTAVLPLLTDPSPAVTRQVVEFLRGKFVEVATLRELLAADRPVHTRRAAAALLRDRDTWVRLHTDLTLLADADLGADAEQDLHACRQHLIGVYTKPTARLRAELEAACDDLDPAMARWIRFLLSSAQYR
ncbi:HEAT repeat-containing protein [Amycolatopsis pretoriensis]|uniref:HEAT repeat-containing protein n=1 Tax=Amycolatopsis pretoriensis TaxID=218821 RepID=A0A1H5RC18_9PSEU|nr:HEAT repeat domain-containing protein [Amycolatopsis pretoriensis]SEF35909.1 HEAT repeat-containing protein [Amycolatopsis pretoriensis]